MCYPNVHFDLAQYLRFTVMPSQKKIFFSVTL